MVDRDELLERFAPTLTDEELARYKLDGLTVQIRWLRGQEPDDMSLTDREIAKILLGG